MRVSRQDLEHMIVYEDASVIVCHKCPYLAVESANVRQQDLVSLLKNRRLSKREEPYIGVIHRIDQPVEGLIVFAKTRDAAAVLSKQPKEGEMSKDYLALVEKNGPLTSTHNLCHYIKKDEKSNQSVVVEEGTAGAKPARLSFQVLEERARAYLLAIQLDTGRHHQIRVQFAALGHPLLGDEKYGAKPLNGQPLALCANHLSFVHPGSKKRMDFEIEPKNNLFISTKEL